MTRQKLKAAMVLIADRDNAARDVAAQLGVSVSTLDAYVDAKGRPRERATELLGKRAAKSAAAAWSTAVLVSFLSDGRHSATAGHRRPLPA